MSENNHINGTPYGGFAEPPYRGPVYYNVLPDFIPAPTIQAPAAQTLAIQAPTIQAPTIQAPAIQAPSVQTPVIQTPLMQTPVIQAPTIQTPVIQTPSIQTPSIQAPTIQAPAAKRNRPIRKRFAVALVCICMIGSAAFGFGGAYLANSLNGAAAVSVTATETVNDTGNYQSIIKTVSVIGTSEKLSIEEAAAMTKDSVVEITTEMVSRSGRMGQFISTGAGSGVIISSDGYIVTNNHVVSGAQTITVRLSDKEEYKATLIGTDAKTDLAVIKIEASHLQPAIFGNSTNLVVGETTIAIGNPLGELGGTVTSGIVSALDREITIDGETMSLLQTDASINPGNSGGGLFNLYGELIGIVNAKSSGSDIEGLGFAIPIDTAKTVIEQIIAYGYVKGRIDTGFVLVDVPDAQTAMFYRVNKLGLYISKSVNSEFQSGDIITAVDGQSVKGLSDFNQLISKYAVGDTVEITVSRSGKSMTLPLTLQELRS